MLACWRSSFKTEGNKGSFRDAVNAKLLTVKSYVWYSLSMEKQSLQEAGGELVYIRLLRANNLLVKFYFRGNSMHLV